MGKTVFVPDETGTLRQKLPKGDARLGANFHIVHDGKEHLVFQSLSGDFWYMTRQEYERLKHTHLKEQ